MLVIWLSTFTSLGVSTNKVYYYYKYLFARSLKSTTNQTIICYIATGTTRQYFSVSEISTNLWTTHVA